MIDLRKKEKEFNYLSLFDNLQDIKPAIKEKPVLSELDKRTIECINQNINAMNKNFFDNSINNFIENNEMIFDLQNNSLRKLYKYKNNKAFFESLRTDYQKTCYKA